MDTVDVDEVRRQVARELVRRSHAVPPPPGLLRLETHLRQGDASARELGRLIEGAPTLAARVLRMANSAWYSPAQPVVNIPRAVAMIGDLVLRQLVLASLVGARASGSRAPDQSLAIARVLGDGVRSAVVCRHIAAMTRLSEPGEAFAAGLLHDLGQIYLVDGAGDAYARYLLDRRNAADLPFEVEIAGTTHEDVGAIFAEELNLPSVLSEVVEAHHDPAPRSLAALVHLSDLLVRELNTMALDTSVAVEVDAQFESIGMTRERWAAELPRVREGYAELLSVFDAVAA